MAAYAAFVSLDETIERILRSSHFSLVPLSPGILIRARTPLGPLKRILKRLDESSTNKSRKKVNGLDEEIKEALWRFEDLLEHHLSDQILSQAGGQRDASSFTIDLQSLRRDVDSFVETMVDLGNRYASELDNMPPVEDDEWVSSRNDFDGMKMLELFSDLYARTKEDLRYIGFYNYFFYFRGMAGSGKTCLVKRLFDEPEITRRFHHHVWVTVGRKSQFSEIAQRILAIVSPNIKQITGGDREIGRILQVGMGGKKCLIVLDDIWDRELLIKVKRSVPNNGNAFLVTTKVLDYSKLFGNSYHVGMEQRMRALSAEESEDLLRAKMFGEADFPPHLKEAAKKIANKCRGLPLMIVVVADLLNNTDAQHWDDVAEKRNSVLRDASDQIAKVLFPSYDCFPQHLKMFFLYVGAFPEDSEIFLSKLTHMLDAEGFLGVRPLRKIVNDNLMGFGFQNDIIVVIKPGDLEHSNLKSCSINPFWRRLFNTESSKVKFLHVIDSSTFDSSEGVKGQRRLCLNSNFIFNFEEVHDSVKRECASNARSLLCFGPYHRYSMPLDVGFKLLRELNALKVRFYIFPIVILNLVQLQYLALSYNGELPTSISKLFNLQFLIILPHVSIKSCGAPSYVPVQIWDMQMLKRVDISGSNLPNPNSDATLRNLETLLGVSPSSCIWEVFKKIPNIRKLGIQIELTPQDEDCDQMNCIFLPESLVTFKCSILNPKVKQGFVAPLTLLSMLPQILIKLHLSGLGYPWEYMKVIGSLPQLEVLKLQCYAFQGPTWMSKSNSFSRLKFLLIEDSDLVNWMPLDGSFPELEHLSLKHCYKLELLCWPNKKGKIDLVDCSPSAVHCAKQISAKQISAKRHSIHVTASYKDEELHRLYSQIMPHSNCDSDAANLRLNSLLMSRREYATSDDEELQQLHSHVMSSSSSDSDSELD